MLTNSIKVIGYHDRAPKFAAIVQYVLEEGEGQIPADDFIPAFKLCSYHEHLTMFRNLAKQNLLYFLEAFSTDEWIFLLKECNTHDSGKILGIFLENLPNAKLGMQHIEHINYHQRGDAVLPMQHFLTKQRQAREADMKRKLKIESEKNTTMAKKAEIRISKEVKENDLTATATERIALLNPSGIQKCEETEMEEEQCVVCLQNKRNVVNTGCGHRVICLQCVPAFEEGRACPLCQKKIVSWLVVS